MIRIAGCVLSAIGFDHETSLDTCEIDDIGRDRMLPPEAPTELLVAQSVPKRPFCFRHIAAQLLCSPGHCKAAPHFGSPFGKFSLDSRIATSAVAPTLTLPRARGREACVVGVLLLGWGWKA